MPILDKGTILGHGRTNVVRATGRENARRRRRVDAFFGTAPSRRLGFTDPALHNLADFRVKLSCLIRSLYAS
jgi:hypothetical protein